MNPALERGIKKALRALVQLAASGALTAAVTKIADGLSPGVGLAVATGWMFVVTFLQNTAETAGIIPVLLPTVGLLPVVGDTVSTIVPPVVGTVEAITDVAGDVTGTVTDLAGNVAGTVTGAVEKLTDQPDT